MKPIRLLALLSLLLIFASACEGLENGEEKSEKERLETTVPAAVKAAFASKFSEATDAKWGREDADFEVDFVLEGVTSSAVFNASGDVLMTEKAVAISSLPFSVMEYVNTNYANYTAIEAEMATETGKGATFEVILSYGGSSYELVFDQEGQFLKLETDAGEDEDEGGEEHEEEGDEDNDDEHQE